MSDVRETIGNVNAMFTSAMEEVALERWRQAIQEGYTPEHDTEHTHHQLALAAVAYTLNATGDDGAIAYWPFERDAWKPKDARRDLIRAAALIIAEIERLDRKVST